MSLCILVSKAIVEAVRATVNCSAGKRHDFPCEAAQERREHAYRLTESQFTGLLVFFLFGITFLADGMALMFTKECASFRY